ncbi:hypothetical protein G6F50_015677 [Rhizopus delemar]|uniref:Glucose-methanol-choline oxidoreductase N-terminal domain-containing protein n=1 Tax=Rhizopus delemar TaxID=936053 RepID=A0A9P6XX02_9FUNG|nr:hypothetical protein G6F50_015677 [Rhizopus delemar]
MSTAKCFLKPAMARKNLDVRTYAQATRVLFDGARAVGVAYCHPAHPARVRAVRAKREVIVACGAINTPKLLQLSGLGPAELLHEHGIPVVCDLRGVGEHLSDHYSVRIVARPLAVQAAQHHGAQPVAAALLLEIAAGTDRA